MLIDFTPLGDTKLADIQDLYTHADLITATNEMIDHILDLIKDARNSYVTFQPVDPIAYDPAATTVEELEIPWTLGHVIVHTTASGEEGASRGAALARGVQVTWRDRYEVPWETMKTVDQLVHRLEESRRIRLAYLSAWPDEPHFDVMWTIAPHVFGELNAIGATLLGLKHDNDHLGQIKEVMQQAREALG